jgi:hypothetical protein
MSDIRDDGNPPRIELTQIQRDEVFRQGYWSQAIRYAIQYYVSGRFAAASGFTPVLANLLHHAVELMLKACLAYDDSVAQIRRYGNSRNGYRHNLPLLWSEFKRRNLAVTRPGFDQIIDALHKFEEIRYPEQLVDGGATIAIDIFDVEGGDTRRDGETSFVLKLPQIDELMGILFTATRCNPAAFLGEVDDERRRMYYDRLTTSLFGRAEA